MANKRRARNQKNNKYRYRRKKKNINKEVILEKKAENSIQEQKESSNTTDLTIALDKLFNVNEINDKNQFINHVEYEENIVEEKQDIDTSSLNENDVDEEEKLESDIINEESEKFEITVENSPIEYTELEEENKQQVYGTDDFINSNENVTNDENLDATINLEDVLENINEETKEEINDATLYDANVNLFSNEDNIKQDYEDISKENIDDNELNKEKKAYTQNESLTKNNIYFGYNARLLINIVGLLVFAVLAITLFVSSISIKAKSSVLYNQTSNLDYKVYLKQNDYYNEPYLPKNMQYIASLIDYVDVTFNYNFSVNQNINYKYTYYIQSDISITSSDDSKRIIYSKTDKLTEPDTLIKENSTGFNVSKNVKINYAEYNDLVKAFKSSYAINADSNLILTLLVEIEDEKGNKIKQQDKDSIKLTIPLTEQMIDISMDYNEVNNTNNVTVYKDFSISNQTSFIISIISLIISFIFIVRLILFLKKTSFKKTIYDVTLAKILREYDRVIVNSKKIVDLNDDVVDVNSFNELLDVRDNLEKPIIFSEVHKGQKSIFIVKTPNETYRYILKLVDLEKEKEK